MGQNECSAISPPARLSKSRGTHTLFCPDVSQCSGHSLPAPRRSRWEPD